MGFYSFTTSDGFVLNCYRDEDFNRFWSDGDLEFNDDEFHPIDCTGERLEGQFLVN
jgi:hypothetical protein